MMCVVSLYKEGGPSSILCHSRERPQLTEPGRLNPERYEQQNSERFLLTQLLSHK